MPLEIINIENLSAQYGKNEVLKDINFTVHEGDFIGLVGPNGSGKSTLIKVMFGLLRPSYGTISIFSQNLSSFKDWHRLGYFPQRTTLTNLPLHSQ